MKKATIEKFADVLASEIGEWTVKLNQEFEKVIKRSGTKYIQEAKKKTPTWDNEVGKQYINCFINKKTSNPLVRIIWNKKYQLSHLLENGHYVYNRKGRKKNLKSRVSGKYTIKHSKYPESIGKKTTKSFGMWSNAADEIEKYMEEQIKKAVKEINGGI